MIGVDEVGRGCWAGPLLVVAARQTGKLPDGLRDSKLMTKQQRESIFEHLASNVQFSRGWVTSAEIDEHGLSKALTLGAKRALNNLKANYDDEILLDGKHNYLPRVYKNSRSEVDADLKSPIVSAASVYAKVIRDRFMCQLAKKHPNYGFEKHVGYGTALHKSALEAFGILNEIHRVSFRPIKLLAGAE